MTTVRDAAGVRSASSPRTARWPWLVLAAVVVSLGFAEALTVHQHLSGVDRPYEYWFEGAVGTLGYAIVGALICARVPGHRVGRLMIAFGCLGALQAVSGSLAVQGSWQGWPDAVVAVLGALFAGSQTGLVFLLVGLLLIVPTGEPRNARWAVVLRVWFVVGLAGCLGSALAGPSDQDSLQGYRNSAQLLPESATTLAQAMSSIAFVVMLVVVALGILCLALRWRDSRGDERAQLAWVVTCAAATPVVILLSGLVSWLTGLSLPTPAGASLDWGLAALLLPAGIAVSVLKHGLYDLGRVVSRTVSYAVVTALVVLVYAGVVATASMLLGSRSSTPVVALATLVAAAAFRPLLRRVRAVVDHRFNRARYDAQAIVMDYATRLERVVALDDVETGLDDAVRRSVGPSTATLWLRGDRITP